MTETSSQTTANDATRLEAGRRQVMLTNVDLWSATKVGAVFAGTVFAVWVIAWALLWFVLSVAGVWNRLNSLIVDITGFDAITGGMFFGLIIVVGAIEFLVLTALAPLAAVIYNSTVSFIGGLNFTVDDEL